MNPIQVGLLGIGMGLSALVALALLVKAMR